MSMLTQRDRNFLSVSNKLVIVTKPNGLYVPAARMGLCSLTLSCASTMSCAIIHTSVAHGCGSFSIFIPLVQAASQEHVSCDESPATARELFSI